MLQSASEIADRWQKINFSTVVMIASALSLIKGLLSIKFFTNILSESELAFYSLGIVAINFSMQAISLYLPWTLPRLLARFDRHTDSDEKYDYISSIVVIYLIIGGIFLGGYIIISRLLGEGTGTISQIVPISILIGMLGSISLTYLGLAIYRQSPKNYIAIQNGLDFVPLLIAIVIVFRFQRTGRTALNGMLIGYIIITIILALHYLKREKLGRASKVHMKLALSYSSPFATTSILVILTPTLLIFLVQIIFGSADVAMFYVGWSVATIGVLFNAIPNVVFAPRLFKLYETKGLLDALSFTQHFLKIYLFITIPLYAVLAFFAQPIITVMSSSQFISSSGLFIILLAGQIVYGIQHFTGIGIPLTYRVWELPKSYAIGLIGGLFTALTLADFGPIGIAFGYLVCNLIFIMISYSVTKNIIRSEVVSKKTYILLILGVLIFVPVLLLTRFLIIESILQQLILFTIIALSLTAIFAVVNVRFMTIHSDEVRTLFKTAGAERLLKTGYVHSVLNYLEKVEQGNGITDFEEERKRALEKLNGRQKYLL